MLMYDQRFQISLMEQIEDDLPTSVNLPEHTSLKPQWE